LFTGEKRVGKTTAVRRVIELVGVEHFCGFTTREERPPGSRRTGFSIELLDGRSGTLAAVDSESDLRVGRMVQPNRPRYGVELEFLEAVAVPLLRREIVSHAPRILVIDEIGPMQLFSAVFWDVLVDALASDCIVLGTIVARSFAETDELKKRPGVETFLLTEANRTSLATMMALYLQSEHVAGSA
jgi:nucleoside-triphosphatase